MPPFIGPHATVEKHVTLPESAQLGQTPTSTQLNAEFVNPIHVRDSRQVLVIGPVGTRVNGIVTAVYGQGVGRDQVYVFTGCFGGTLEMFEDAVIHRKVQGDPHRVQYEFVITLIRRMMVYRMGKVEVPAGAEFFDDYG